MKTKYILLFLGLLIMLSCKEDYISKNADTQFKGFNPVVLTIENIGYLHNVGCIYILYNWDTTWNISDEQDFQAIWGMICDYFVSNHNFDSVEAYSTLYGTLCRISSSNDFLNELNLVFDELKQHYVWTNLISQVEKSFIDAILEIFTNDFSNLSHSQVCDSVISKVVSLKNLWNTIEWDESGDSLLMKNRITSIQSNGSGNLSFGALDVLHRSAEFWKENDPMPNSPPALLGALLQVDAIGYIVGWLKAVKDDYDTGQLRPDRANIRIQKGIDAATYASLGWALGRR